MAKKLAAVENRYRKAIQNRRETILAARAAGMTMQQIADAIGMSKTGVVMFIQRAGKVD